MGVDFSYKQYLIFKKYRETKPKDNNSLEFLISKYGDAEGNIKFKEIIEKPINQISLTNHVSHVNN